MLRRLKRKFILTNLALVFIVMTGVLAAGLTANSVQFSREYRAALERELAQDLFAPPRDSFRTAIPRRDDRERPAKLAFTAVRGKDGRWMMVTPWMQVDDETLAALCERALAARAAEGFWADAGIAYARKEDRVAFVNLQNEHAQLRTGRLAWCLVYLGALGVFAVIILFLSRWALRPVEQSWDQQHRFVSDASHELKTPLTVILANLDILQAERGDSRWLSAARAEGLHMKQLIEDLLFLARSDEARQPARLQVLSMTDTAHEAALAFETLAFENGLRLHTDIAPDVHVRGDAGMLRQLANILMDNAVKYTPSGGTIRLSLQRQRDRVALCVENSPAYIEPAELARLFDRFYRLDKARAKPAGGYGLGLSIAAEIARQHGGALRAASSRETGTSFTLSMPAAAGERRKQ